MMRRCIVLAAAFVAAFTIPAETVKTASQPWVTNYVAQATADKLDAPGGVVSGNLHISGTLSADAFAAIGSGRTSYYTPDGVTRIGRYNDTTELSYPDDSGTFATREWVETQLAAKADAEKTAVVTQVVVSISAESDWWTCDWNSVKMDRVQFLGEPHYLHDGYTLYWVGLNYNQYWVMGVDGEELGRLPYDANAIALDFGNGYTLTRGGYTLVTNLIPATVSQSVMYSSGGNISIHATTDPDGVKRYRLYDND